MATDQKAGKKNGGKFSIWRVRACVREVAAHGFPEREHAGDVDPFVLAVEVPDEGAGEDDGDGALAEEAGVAAYPSSSGVTKRRRCQTSQDRASRAQVIAA